MTNLAGRLFVRVLERYLAPLDLMPAHMPVLLALEDGRALPQKALADRAHVEQPTMAATLNRMERDGLVSRRPNPDDGRSTLVALTPLALQKIPAVERAVEAINALALTGLPPEEHDRFFALLHHVVTTLQAAEETAQS